MVLCNKCKSKNSEIRIEYARMSLCRDCFIDFYKARVQKTVEEFKMFGKNDRVGVAVSGGKDSAALLHFLRQAYPNLELKAFHINLGIPEYSAHCQQKVEELADMLNVELHVFNLEKELGITIEDFKKTPFKLKICSVCGTIKRRVLEQLAIKNCVQVLATAHNLEDVLSIMLNNFLHGRWDEFIRLKPVLSPLFENMALKVKPLFKSSENENLLYCVYNNIPFSEAKCPYAKRSSLKKRAKILEILSKHNPIFKHQLLKRFLEIMPVIEKIAQKPELTKCKICGFPSSSEICAFCKRIDMVKKTKDKT